MTELQILAIALCGGACFGIGYVWANPRRLRKFKCALGLHAPDSHIKQEGMYLVQRCLYCDKVTMKMEHRDNQIRRVQ